MDTKYFLNADGELCHWGIKGMKWGVRRYQNKDGSLTPAGEKRRAKLETKLRKLGGNKSSINEEVDIETRKSQIIASRSPKALYENAHLFDTNELNAAYTRLSLERNIKNLQTPEVSKGEQFVNNTINNANKLSATIESGSRLYNNVAKVFNSVYGNSHGTQLPTISERTTSKLDKFREETEWMKAKNERNKAKEESKGKEKSELEILKETTAMIKADNEYRKALHTKEQYDQGNWNNKDTKENKGKKDEDEDEEDD